MVRLNEISSRAAKLSVRMQRKVKGQEKGQGDGKMMGSIDSSKSGEDNEVRSRCKYLWRPTEVINTTSSQTLPTETTTSRVYRR